METRRILLDGVTTTVTRDADELVAPDHVYDAARTWALRFVGSSPQVLAAAKAAFATR